MGVVERTLAQWRQQGLYQHPEHGFAFLIAAHSRREGPLGVTFFTLAGERFVAAGSAEEREWIKRS